MVALSEEYFTHSPQRSSKFLRLSSTWLSILLQALHLMHYSSAEPSLGTSEYCTEADGTVVGDGDVAYTIAFGVDAKKPEGIGTSIVPVPQASIALELLAKRVITSPLTGCGFNVSLRDALGLVLLLT